MAKSKVTRVSITLTDAEAAKLVAIVQLRHPLRNRAQSTTVAELINEEYERSRQQRLRDAKKTTT